jgi:hypothetical protein
MPFIGILLVTLLVTTYVPSLSTYLPSLSAASDLGPGLQEEPGAPIGPAPDLDQLGEPETEGGGLDDLNLDDLDSPTPEPGAAPTPVESPPPAPEAPAPEAAPEPAKQP